MKPARDQLLDEVARLKRQLKQTEQHRDRQLAHANLRLAMLRRLTHATPIDAAYLSAIIKYVERGGEFSDTDDKLTVDLGELQLVPYYGVQF